MRNFTSVRRKLWTMSCESIFQNIAASLSRTVFEKLFTKHSMAFPESKYGQVALYQEAHKHCHHDGPFSRYIQRYLNRKHGPLIKRVAMNSPEIARLTIEAMLMANTIARAEELAGFLWAITSDPRPELRTLEQGFVEELHLLSHCLLLAQFQGDIVVSRAENSAPNLQHIALEQKVRQLTTVRRTLTASLQRLEQQRGQLTEENDRLQSKLKALTECCAFGQRHGSPSPPATHHDSQARELRKLQYQVDKLTACVKDKEVEIQRLETLVESYTTTTSRTESVQEEAESAHFSYSSVPLSPLTLHGKTIALIGGLGKASTHYEHIIQELGGYCLYHDGDLRHGRKRFAEMIHQADIVLCPVDCNSHGAATSTKKLCKAMHKPCYFLRSSGISYVREKLREIAQMESIEAVVVTPKISSWRHTPPV